MFLSPILAFSCNFFFFLSVITHTRFKEPYNDIFKPYSGVLELDLPKVEFHAKKVFCVITPYQV